jgi:hypothetical protein
VFWLSIKEVLSNKDLIVSNQPELGKRKIERVEERIESDLVFPAVRGADVERWRFTPQIYVLIVQDIDKRAGYQEAEMKRRWPRTFGYLLKFKQELIQRAAYQKYHAEAGNPFYSQYNISDYTFARYKVVWKRMANDMFAAVISQHKTPFGYKTIIPTDTTSLFASDNETEAHYLCAIINATPVREFIKSYSSAGRGFGAPSVMNHVGIPKFDPKNKLHRKLSELSKILHELKAEGNLTDVEKYEKEVDEAVCELFGIEA